MVRFLPWIVFRLDIYEYYLLYGNVCTLFTYFTFVYWHTYLCNLCLWGIHVACTMVCLWRSEDSLRNPVLLFPHVGIKFRAAGLVASTLALWSMSPTLWFNFDFFFLLRKRSYSVALASRFQLCRVGWPGTQRFLLSAVIKGIYCHVSPFVLINCARWCRVDCCFNFSIWKLLRVCTLFGLEKEIKQQGQCY